MLDKMELQSYQMHNILFYIIFSKHSAFVIFLIKEMIKNIKEQYCIFEDTIQSLQNMQEGIEAGRLDYKTLVVVFFFYLSVDSKMRHWLLCSQLSISDSNIRDHLIKKNIHMVPMGMAAQSLRFACPFLGQAVVFAPLRPYEAVPIMLAISDEHFFLPVMTDFSNETVLQVYQKIKQHVIFA